MEHAAIPSEAVISVRGERVPAIGLGTWELNGDACVRTVERALAIGYRHIDTAQMYGNEAEVGRGIRQSSVGRDEVFLTTKIAQDSLRADAVRGSVEASLERLETEHVDLLLIHWPSDTVPLDETIGAMEEVRRAGLARHLGVSNFPPSLAERAGTLTELFCDQVEYHPYLRQDRLIEMSRSAQFLFTAYSPLARGRVASDETLTGIGRNHGKTAAQVTLRWLIQQGVAAIPKASSEEHLRANIDIFDFSLDDDEMERINALGGEHRLIDPDWAPDWET